MSKMNCHPTIADLTELPLDYTNFCVELVSPPREKSLKEIDTIHMVYGIVGELIEFRNTCESNPRDIPNYKQELLKEAGDILFYLAAYGYKISTYVQLNSFTEEITDKFFLKVFKDVDNFFDLNKKKYFYNNASPDLVFAIQKSFIELCYSVTLMLHSFFSYKEIIDANFEKLKARYPQGFNLSASIARADETTAANTTTTNTTTANTTN